MPRRAANITQADIARILRAYRNEGVSVRTRLMPDGSTSFEPIARDEREGAVVNVVTSVDKEVVL
jgi:hypothetical protein